MKGASATFVTPSGCDYVSLPGASHSHADSDFVNCKPLFFAGWLQQNNNTQWQSVNRLHNYGKRTVCLQHSHQPQREKAPPRKTTQRSFESLHFSSQLNLQDVESVTARRSLPLTSSPVDIIISLVNYYYSVLLTASLTGLVSSAMRSFDDASRNLRSIIKPYMVAES